MSECVLIIKYVETELLVSQLEILVLLCAPLYEHKNIFYKKENNFIKIQKQTFRR